MFIGTDAELTQRLKNFDDHVIAQKQLRNVEKLKLQDVGDDLENTRKENLKLKTEMGRLEAAIEVSFDGFVRIEHGKLNVSLVIRARNNWFKTVKH